MPPISCTEIESIIKAEVKETTIEFAETTISEDDRNFNLKKGSYPIEVNEKNERFVKVIFEKNN